MSVKFNTSRYAVGPEFVTSNGDLYALADIQHVRLRRPWLVVTGAACSGALALAAVFWPELHFSEKASVIAFCTAALTGSARIGRLKLSSMVLRDGDGIVWGDYSELEKLKRSIETALVQSRIQRPSTAKSNFIQPEQANQET